MFSMHRHDTQRYLFIDLLRFGAVVFMLQGHTFDALLASSVKHSSFFYLHDFFHGLIAPMFLFSSGVAFGVSTFKKWQEHLSFTRVVRKRIARFTGLIVVGYALHLPFFSLNKILHDSTAQEMAAFLQVDALQCIAVTLLFLQILILIVRTEKRLVLFAVIIAPLIVFISPIIWNISFQHSLPLWLGSYLNAENNSWFPLVPWSTYLLFGVTFAHAFVYAKENGEASLLMKRVAAGGVIVIIGMVMLANIPFHLYGPHDFWKVNPTVLFARTAFVATMACCLYFVEQLVHIPTRLPMIMGSESLVIYVLHLIIIYGSVINNGLQYSLGGKLSLVEAIGVFLLVLVAMSTFAYIWHSLKMNFRRESVLLKFALTATFLFYFVTRPY